MAGPPRLLTKDFQRTTFRASHRVVLRALAEAMFDPDGELDDAALETLVDDADAYVSAASKTLRFGLLVMLVVLRWSPLLSLRLRPLERLMVDERLACLERLERSRIRQLPLVVAAYKTLLTMLFYDDDVRQAALGYPGAIRHRYRRGLPIAEEG